MNTPTNEDRYERAANTLHNYAGRIGVNYRREMETVVTDLLTDIRHFCDREKISFELAVAISQEAFKEENKEGRPD